MPNTYLISYDLYKPRRDYDDLYKYLKSFPRWVHIFESMWLIKSNKEYETISNEIENTVYPEDRISISRVYG